MMSRTMRTISVCVMGIYLSWLSYQLHLEPWLNIMTIIFYAIYLCWENIHAVKVREIVIREQRML